MNIRGHKWARTLRIASSKFVVAHGIAITHDYCFIIPQRRLSLSVSLLRTHHCPLCAQLCRGFVADPLGSNGKFEFENSFLCAVFVPPSARKVTYSSCHTYEIYSTESSRIPARIDPNSRKFWTRRWYLFLTPRVGDRSHFIVALL